EVPASAASSSIPTVAPRLRTVRIADSTSSWRRCWRCSSQRELRPSVVVLTGTDGSRYFRYLLPSVSHTCTHGDRGEPPSVPLTPTHDQETCGGHQSAASRRRPRRQPHPLRPPVRPLRRGVQPGHVHR